MELIYIWVKKHKNIEQQGFNFSSCFSCDYNAISKTLRIQKKEGMTPSFFGDTISVTAVVGKNGSGKSNLLELIAFGKPNRAFRDSEVETLDPTYDLLIYYDSNSKKFHLYGMQLINSQSSKQVIDIDEDFEPLEVNLTESDNTPDDIGVIYYSSSSEAIRDLVRDPDNIRDLSEYSAFQALSRELMNNHHVHEWFFTTWFLTDSDNVQKTIDLLNKAVKWPSDFVLPDTITFSLNNSYTSTAYNKFVDKKIDDNDKNVFSILNKRLSNPSGNPIPTKFDCDLVLILIRALIMETDLTSNGDYTEIKRELAQIEQLGSYDRRCEKYKSILDILFSVIERKDTELVNTIKEIRNTFEKIEQLNPDRSQKEKLTLKINDNIEYITKVIDCYKILLRKNNPRFIESHFRPRMSSGGKEMLYLMAKISDALNSIGSTTQDIVLILDEPTVFSHPNWQKKFLNILLSFLSSASEVRFHLLIATHSPFVLSDIPRDDILFLDIDENGKCILVDGLMEKKQTFGANIHTLLSDSFFMDDGLMGDFAKNKIEQLIKYLNDEESFIKNDNEAQGLLSIIGEPIIKQQLQRMLDSKRLHKVDDIEVIKNDISQLKKRLEEMESDNDKSR